jgi:hypothetical protein
MDAMNLATKTLVVVAAGALLAAPAAAGITGSVGQSFGTDNYRGTKATASLDIGDSLYVSPSLSTYRTDSSSGSYYDVGLRVGYDIGPLSLGVQGSVVPKHDGYKQDSFGGDVTFSLAPGGTKHGRRMAGPDSHSNQTFGYGLAGVDVGVSANHTTHTDDFLASGSSAAGLRAAGAARSTAYKLGQTDLAAFAGAKFLIAEVSAQVTKTVYDKSLDSTIRESPFLSLTGVNAVQAGFPKLSYNVSAKVSTLPLVHPYVSYTRTEFELNTGHSNSAEVGAVVGLNMLSVKASYTHYTQTGYKDNNYASVGAGLNF